MVNIMDAPERTGAQARALAFWGYPGLAIKLVMGDWWLVQGSRRATLAGCQRAAPNHQPPITNHPHAFLTSATKPVNDFFASPNSIDVFGL